jgi:hypothetical protein
MALFIEFLYAVGFFDIFCYRQLERFAVVPIAAPIAALQYQKKYFISLLLHFEILCKCSVMGRYSLAGRLCLNLERTQHWLTQILNRSIGRSQLCLWSEA